MGPFFGSYWALLVCFFSVLHPKSPFWEGSFYVHLYFFCTHKLSKTYFINVVVSQILQYAASKKGFGNESPHLECMNPFIIECHDKFKDFFAACCQVSKKPNIILCYSPFK